MKPCILFVLFVCASLNAFSQSEPKIVGYFDSNWQRTTKGKADYYRTVEPAPSSGPTDKRYLVKDYYNSGQLQMEAICTAYEPKLIWKGLTKLYHENGAVKEEGMFENEERIGFHTYWYEDGKKKEELIHRDKKTLYAQFWSPAGEPLLVNGNGTVHDSDDPVTSYFSEIQDSLVVAYFQVDAGADTLYTIVPQQPEYTGGYNKLVSDLRSIVQYPKQARKTKTEGRVFVMFIIDKQGKMRDAKVVKGIGVEMDAEALRAVSKLNTWNPGLLRGKPVAVRYVLPINFRL